MRLARVSTPPGDRARSGGAAPASARRFSSTARSLLIVDNKVFRTISVSTGKPSTPTPPGSYRVYAKIARWWSVPFREWLPWAVPVVGGIAFHEFGVVPVYPASHGCVRQPAAGARMTYDFAEIGMPVKAVATS